MKTKRRGKLRKNRKKKNKNNRDKKKLTETLNYYLTPGSAVLLQKLKVLQLVTQLPEFYGTEISVPCS
jgi:hypothetical protein